MPRKKSAKKPKTSKLVPDGKMRVRFLRVGCDPGEEPFVVGQTYDLATENAIQWLYYGACESVT